MRAEYLILITCAALTIFGYGEWGETKARLDAVTTERKLIYSCIESGCVAAQRSECREILQEMKHEFTGE